mmetsp:Transcript_21563/g.44344  ORF Transcript_21563/g.44344 Transcript_21563/m.44344 type:complete len:115 (-) Transcript_21563:783-1127(-)
MNRYTECSFMEYNPVASRHTAKFVNRRKEYPQATADPNKSSGRSIAAISIVVACITQFTMPTATPEQRAMISFAVKATGSSSSKSSSVSVGDKNPNNPKGITAAMQVTTNMQGT